MSRQQRLRDSVAPGPGTIVFVNPQDHPGIGTPGGAMSAMLHPCGASWYQQVYNSAYLSLPEVRIFVNLSNVIIRLCMI